MRRLATFLFLLALASGPVFAVPVGSVTVQSGTGQGGPTYSRSADLVTITAGGYTLTDVIAPTTVTSSLNPSPHLIYWGAGDSQPPATPQAVLTDADITNGVLNPVNNGTGTIDVVFPQAINDANGPAKPDVFLFNIDNPGNNESWNVTALVPGPGGTPVPAPAGPVSFISGDMSYTGVNVTFDSNAGHNNVTQGNWGIGLDLGELGVSQLVGLRVDTTTGDPSAVVAASRVVRQLVHESFEGYPIGRLEDDNDVAGNKGTGFADEWRVTDSMRPYVTVAPKAMTYQAGEVTVVGGQQAMRIGGPGLPGDIIDHTPRRSFAPQDDGDVWFSFLVETGADTSTPGDTGGRDFIQFAFDHEPPRSNTQTLSALIDNRGVAGGDHLFAARAGGSSQGSNGNTVFSAIPNAPATTQLVVGCLRQNGAGQYDTVEVYVNPTSATDPGAPDAASTWNISDPLTAIESIRNRIAFLEPDDEVFIDEIRIGRTYGDVLARYENLVRAASPVAYWRLNDVSGRTTYDTVAGLGATVVGNVNPSVPGPQMGFESINSAAAFDGQGARYEVADPGAGSVLDFSLGDQITLEAWVQLDNLNAGQQHHIIGKGRTAGGSVNQNYALRLRNLNGDGETGVLSFIYRDAGGWNRWQSEAAITEGDGQWHHLALTYTFGDPDSIVGYIDGEPSGGSWDLGTGANAPIQDDDELWIGSALGGQANSSWFGLLDEAAIYNRALTADEIASHFAPDVIPEPTTLAVLALGGLALAGRRRRRRAG